MPRQKTIAFFPEAAFGPALNSVGIAQACEKLGHKAVFMTDPGMSGVYSSYGFDEYPVNMSQPMAAEAMARYWQDFINGHIGNFNKSPLEQIDTYVKDCWSAIVDTAMWAEKDLPGVLERVQPDLVCVDNVVLFPAIKRYGKPWVRIISCSENEIPDPAIPPHLSGCGEADVAGFAAYETRFNEVIGPIHARCNVFLGECGEVSYPAGQFFEASPYLNLLLYPAPVKFKRQQPLDPAKFQYLEGCVRQDVAYTVPDFGVHNDKPLVYVSFGSLGAGDTALLNRLIEALGKFPCRALVNIGGYAQAYQSPPANVHLAAWFPQPALIAQCDVVIHHGGNNSFTECLYFGVPAIIMPYVWDGHDNAARVQETGHGLKMHRSDWTEAELTTKLTQLLGDAHMKTRLQATAAHMQARHGPSRAAQLLDKLLEGTL